ncbi:MAG: energy transducer TonB [Alphaproteobacteria bacterium]
MIGVSKAQWSGALAIALGLHLAIAAAWLRQAPSAGAVHTGQGGIAAALGPSGAAPGALAANLPPEEPSEVGPEEISEVTPDLETVPESEPWDAAPREVGKAAEIQPEEATEIASDIAPMPLRADGIPPSEAPVVEIAEAVPVEPKELAAITTAPSEEKAPIVPPPPKPRPPEPADSDAAGAPTVASLPGAGGEAGTREGADTGSGDDSAGGGSPGARADYLQVLQAWLEQHKMYPQNAIRRRQEGVVMLRFVMDRDGRVLHHEISNSSGYRLLDLAVESLIERAQPLPAMPPQMKDTELTLVVPINFTLE